MSYGKIQGYRELREDIRVQGATGRYKGYRELREDTRGTGRYGKI